MSSIKPKLTSVDYSKPSVSVEWAISDSTDELKRKLLDLVAKHHGESASGGTLLGISRDEQFEFDSVDEALAFEAEVRKEFEVEEWEDTIDCDRCGKTVKVGNVHTEVYTDKIGSTLCKECYEREAGH